MLFGKKALRAKAVELAIRFWHMIPEAARKEALIRIDPRGKSDILLSPVGDLAEAFLGYLTGRRAEIRYPSP